MRPEGSDSKKVGFVFRPRLLALSVAACFAAGPAFSLPSGPQVVAGAASFQQVGNSLNIGNTPGAIINWNAFSIGAAEVVRFNQQNSLSSVLNRVTGSDSSTILGQLTSNGRVWLVNPNGILFGPNSRVDVNGLVASTLNVSNADFLAGRMAFTGDSNAAIKNAGVLNAANNIYLVGADIENSGIIRSAQGEVLLAAGRQVTLVDAAHPDIQVVVSAPNDKVVNIGEIAAGKISVFGSLIQQRGRMNADRVEVDDRGRIVFRATKQIDVEASSTTTVNGPSGGSITLQTTEGDTYVRGAVEATGKVGAGGTAQVLGNRVAVMDQASVDVSGETGGGTILVGGDYRGQNPAVQNSQVTYLGPDAMLKANAGKVGDGGTVIVWADNTNRAHGSIEAKGGTRSGIGGFVETSGRYLETGGIRLNVGQGGTWLLDPYDITIGANGINTVNDAGTPLTYTASGTPATVAASAIYAALNDGTSVIVDTTGAGSDVGDITVNTAITKTSGGSASLTLKAHDDIFIYAPISSSADTLDVTLIANQTGGAPSGMVSVGVGGSIASYGGNVTLSGKSISIGGSGIDAGTGSISLTSTYGGIAQTQPLIASSISLNNANSAILVNTSNAVGSLTATGSGELQFLTTTALDVGLISKPSATVRLTADGAVTQSDAITAGFLDVNSDVAITLDNTANSVNTFKGVTDGDLLFKNSKAFAVEAVSYSGNVELHNLGSGSISTVSGDSLGIKAHFGDITIHGDLLNAGSIEVGIDDHPSGTLTVNGDFVQQASGMLRLYADDTFTHSAATVTGAATLSGTLYLANVGGSPPSGTYSLINAGTYSGGFTSVTGGSGLTYNSATGEVTVPVIFTWDDGGSDGLWLTPTNWSGDTVPTAADNVDLGSYTVSLSGSASANSLTCTTCSLGVSNGTLTLTGNGTLHELILGLNGGIAGSATKSLSVGENFSQHSSASISGFNYINIHNSSTSLNVGNISTSGFTNYTSGTSGVIQLYSGSTITQQAGTTLSGSAIRITANGDVILNNANPTGVIAANFQAAGDLEYTSTNPIKIASVDAWNGESFIAMNGINVVSGYAKLSSSSNSGVAFTQTGTAPITTTLGLALVGTGSSNQSVSLMLPSNDFPLVAASFINGGDIQIMQGGSSSLTVDTVDSVTGITATNGATSLKLVNAHAAGSLLVSEPISLGTGAGVSLSAGTGGITLSQPLSADFITLRADGAIDIASPLTAASWVQLSNRDATNFYVKADQACTGGSACVEISDFANIEAPVGIAFGDNDTHVTSGTLSVMAAIDTSTFAGVTKPAFVALLGGTSGTIDIAAPVTLSSGGTFVFYGGTVENIAQTISAANVAGRASSAELYFTGSDTSIVNFSPPAGAATTFNGIEIGTGGTLELDHGNSNYFLNGGGVLKSPSILINAGSIGTAATPLVMHTNSLSFTAAAEGIFVSNTSTGAAPYSLTITGTANSTAPSGTVAIDNTGATIVAAGGVSANGNIDITAHSPLTINGLVSSTAGSVGLTSSGGDALQINGSGSVAASTGVSLTAGGGGSMTVNGAVSTNTGTVLLAAGSQPTGSAIITVGGVQTPVNVMTFSVTTAAGGGGTQPPPPPTIDACVANPSLAGCAAVLPTLDACTMNPTAAGCTAVLPPLATCVATPSAPGCAVVLPTLDVCTTNPTAAGCTAVLPPLATCVATPSAPGCAAVLPTLDACTTNPTTAGCAAVLPTLAICTSTPTAAGCTAVLPPLATCVATPSAPGCAAVLPTLDACTTNPTTAGCAAVLPTLAACTSTPTAAGCAAVLPPLATCIATPSAPGCSAVLPPPTLPTDQQLACLVDPTTCAGNNPLPSEVTQPIVAQLQGSEQQLVLANQLGQSESGRPDLTLFNPSGAGLGNTGGGGGGSGGGTSPQSGSGPQGQSDDRRDNEPQGTQQGAPGTPQGSNNANTPINYCN